MAVLTRPVRYDDGAAHLDGVLTASGQSPAKDGATAGDLNAAERREWNGDC